MTDRAIRSIAVAGSGIVGLSAALAFGRALPGAAVSVVPVPPDPAALADRMPTAWPSVGAFHLHIDLDELDLLRRGIAVHHVGTVFDDWPTHGSWVHGFGPHGKPVGAVRFDQIWVRALRTGEARRYEEYSAAEVLARAAKFVHPRRGTNSFNDSFQYGLRMEPDLYRKRLLNHAQASGIRVVGSPLQRVDRDGGKISGLVAGTGERIEADFFVDCTGPAGLVIKEVDDSFEEWPSISPLQLEIEMVDEITPASAARVSATKDGWTAEWPLRDRTVRCTAGDNTDEGVAITMGRRTRPLAGNVLALGDAALSVSPMFGLNLALVHRATFLAIELLPSRQFNPVELAEFNRRWALITEQVRDLTFLLETRAGRPANATETLAERIDQYRHRGRLPYQEDEVLNRDDWTSAFIGTGIVPQNIDPAAAGVPLDPAIEAMNRIADELADFVARAPAYPDYLAQITGER